MRTNFAGLFLAVGMGLIIILLGVGTLSIAGLVSIMPAGFYETEEQMPTDEGPVIRKGPVAVATSAKPASAAEASAIAAGDALFKANCAQCHAVNEKVVGPALAGITKRRSISWLIPWIKNSAKVVTSGDVYAVKLFEDNGKQQMPSFPQLSEKDIKDIIAYVSQQQGVSAQESSTAVAYN